VIEFHGITNNMWNCNYSDKIKCLEKLSKTHYIVHAHGNNCGSVRNNIPDVIELTYVNKNYFNSIPELNTQSLPIRNLDFPNNGSKRDINLNFYPFIKKHSIPFIKKHSIPFIKKHSIPFIKKHSIPHIRMRKKK
jgi:hypothetical protein